MSDASQPLRVSHARLRRVLVYLTLVLAGGSIYVLPYMRQSYHNTLRAALDVTNTELGFLNSVFGIAAMLCYLPGGWLADRCSTRKLLTFSLICTGLAGLYFATLPPYGAVLAIHLVWGVCTVLTFWAAMIKAVREWGAEDAQGRTFGCFEGGRGVVEGVVALIAVAAFTASGEGTAGLTAVIVVYSVVALVAAAGVWWLLEDSHLSGPGATRTVPRLSEMTRVVRMPITWLLAVVVLTAYAAYWGTFDISAFAEDAFGESAAAGAQLSTFRMWIRAGAPIAAGWLADRFRTSATICLAFWVMVASFVLFAGMPATGGLQWVLWANTAVAAFAIFTLRGIYFALLQEGRIPAAATGIVVGAVSLIGYSPDAWSPLLVGYLLDRSPGAAGHQHYFLILAALCVIGSVASLLVGRYSAKRPSLDG